MDIMTLFIIMMIVVAASIVVYCLTPPDKSEADLTKYDSELVWKRLIVNGKFRGYLHLYESTIEDLSFIFEKEYTNYSLEDLTEEDYQ